ncbi:Guanine nucleotide-exchange factor SEC12 [Leucoagaricus sp. SymC.cos]|nr:Guanine nucleotide-exchange factor SEC12 [Leucoagaricus sp. SymC.cos]
MRPHHTQHSLPAFPIHSAAFVAADRLVVGGGGGSSKSGIKNKLRLYSIASDRSIGLKSEFEVEDAPTSMAVDLQAKYADSLQSNTIICGINSPPEKILKGQNENCRLFRLNKDSFHLDISKSTLPADEDDYQKVTVLSPDRKLLAVAGCHSLSVLSLPGLTPVAPPIQLEKEIYDATFSSSGETLVVATTQNLHVYSTKVSSPASPKKGKGKNKSNKSSKEEEGLQLVQSIDLPKSIGGPGTCTFRSVRFHPLDDNVAYTVINTSPPRERGRKMSARQGYVSKWTTQTWTVEKQKKIGDKGLTAFDVSLDGRFLGYGSSDLSIGLLDPKSLTPLCTILKAHEFPPTAVKFDPTTTIVASGSADNSLRIVAIPEVVGGSSWTIIILVLLTLLVVVIAVAMHNERLRW